MFIKHIRIYFCMPLIVLLIVTGTYTDDPPKNNVSEDLSSQKEDIDSSEENLDKALNDIWPSLSKPWTGDLDGMVERGKIRLLTTFTLGSYFIDKGRQMGDVYEMSLILEKFFRQRLKDGGKRLKLVIIPVRRNMLIPYIVNGYGDIALANITVTPGQLESVDFSKPLRDNVQELLVTGPATPPVKDLEDLSGKEVVVPENSSYHENLRKLNEQLRQKGKTEVKINISDPQLEAEDILEMVNAGLLPMTVMDNLR